MRISAIAIFLVAFVASKEAVVKQETEANTEVTKESIEKLTKQLAQITAKTTTEKRVVNSKKNTKKPKRSAANVVKKPVVSNKKVQQFEENFDAEIAERELQISSQAANERSGDIRLRASQALGGF